MTDMKNKTEQKARDAFDSSKQLTKQASARAGGLAEERPLALLAGGVAVGAVLGALLPRTAREADLLGPLGKRLNDSATAAIKAARETGRQELDQAGVSRDAARAQVQRLVDGVMSAASNAGGAAVKAAADKA
ncbi:MAG: hypothetical protein ACTHMG_04005 [Sphingomonas sp.]